MKPILFLLLSVAVVSAAPKNADKSAKFREAVKPGDAGSLARRALAAADNDKELEAVGRALAVAGDKANSVLDELAKDPSVEVATLRAELMLWIARGADMRDASRKGEMPTDELGPRVAALLDHADPFVRGIAEWAMATRLGADYESARENVGGQRVAKPWPGKDAPAWYQRWAAIGPDAMLELDYVRQAAALGVHRSSAALLKSGEGLVKRTENMHDWEGRLSSRPHLSNGGSKAAAPSDVHEAFAKLRAASASDLTTQRKLWLALRRAVRDVALSNKDINFNQIIFAERNAARDLANITVGRWNTHTAGGDIFVKTGFAPADPVKPLLDGRLGPGHVRGLELWWDADRLVFAYARQPGKTQGLRKNADIGGFFGEGTGAVEEMSRLFAMNVDGSNLRQLTEAKYNVDQEPTYLPNGDIVFVSDRSNYGSQCAGALVQDNMILNLYRCSPDGKNLRALSNNKDFDRHPHIMDTGQILFLHWEYQERHLWQTHSLWSCRPDGSKTDALYKQHIESGPMSLREARQIPGSRKLVAIACGHHNFDQGAVFICDYSAGINERDGMRNVTPGVASTEGGYGGVKTVAEGGVADKGGHYMFPYPLSEKSFLVAYSYKRPERLCGLNYGLYYIDVWGNKELIHRDKHLSVAYLAPVRKTPRPPVLEELPPTDKNYAVCSMVNVQANWNYPDAGKIKHLRISQKVPWPCVRDDSKACGFNDLHWMLAGWDSVLGMWDWGAARVIGIVPVEADGSAHFKVPSQQPVYFQALDENFLELRRMRSNVTFQSGETRSCVGCHESRAGAPVSGNAPVPLAMRRAPSVPVPPPWGDRRLPDFEKDIQPIFDRHCVSCHGQKEPKAGLEFTSRKIDGYMQSYRTLFALKASDPTPVSKNYWQHWRPNDPPLSDDTVATSKAFFKRLLTKPPPQQLVTIANYQGGAEVTQPLQFGSGKSKLTLTLLKDPKHRERVKLSADDWQSLVTWVDLNAQYWGTFVEKDCHFASKRARKGEVVPPRRVNVVFPDPWQRPPAGEWVWLDANTAGLKP